MLSISSLIPLCLDSILCSISIPLNMLTLVWWASTRSILGSVSLALGNNAHSAGVQCNVLSLSIRPRWAIMSFRWFMSLVIGGIVILSVAKRDVQIAINDCKIDYFFS